MEVCGPILLSDSLYVTCFFLFWEGRLKTLRLCNFPGMCVAVDPALICCAGH